METIKQRFGEDFIKAVEDFCKNITVAAEDFARAVIELGNDIDLTFGQESGVATNAIMNLLENNDDVREKMQNLITLHGLSALNLFRGFHPNRLFRSQVYVLENIYKDLPEYIPDLIEAKPYKGYSDPKHRLPSKAVKGFKRQNKWIRTRSNPKLR